MKKKVLLVLPYWIRGGAEKQFRYIYEGIANDYDVDILIFNDYEEEIPNLRKKFYIKNNLFDDNNKLIKILLRIKSYLKINSFIKKNLPNYDVAIGHNKLLVPVMPMIKRKCNKVIFSAREADEGFCKGIIRHILSNVDMITCNSDATFDLLEGVNKNLKFIKNGVEIKEDLNSRDIRHIKNIGIIANISRRKNVKLVVESLSLISKDIKISIAGKIADKEYYEEIKSYIKGNNLDNQVEFLNFIESMDAFYNKSDLIILPSLYEGTSNVILESFARKKMILLSDIPENENLVRDKYKDKFMFNPKSPEDLSKKINYLENIINNKKSLIEKILEDNYNLITNEYSIEKLKQEYINLIEE